MYKYISCQGQMVIMDVPVSKKLITSGFKFNAGFQTDFGISFTGTPVNFLSRLQGVFLNAYIIKRGRMDKSFPQPLLGTLYTVFVVD